MSINKEHVPVYEQLPAAGSGSIVATGAGTVPGIQIYAFRGGAASWFGTQILGVLITVCTVGICYPFAVVLVERWRAKNTYLQGRQLLFVGTGWGIFGLWIKWLLLSIITLGIYTFWVYPRLMQWKVEKTVYAWARMPCTPSGCRAILLNLLMDGWSNSCPGNSPNARFGLGHII